ncbi:MAG: C26 family cysteine hydrolase domain-containing family [Bacilli bacterium]|nr:C26 family cysteine hydrolase domain-containing family [Bacilli bacterium]
MKDKIRIGIVVKRTIEDKNRPFYDKYCFVNNFAKRIKKAKGIPYGILFPDSDFEEEYLDIYDGFLLASGSQIEPYHLATIHYAIKHNKPVLGICLGNQALGIYSQIIDKLKNNNIELTYENIINYYKSNSKDEIYMTKIKGHDPEPTFYNHSISKSKHNIYLKPKSLLYNIYDRDVIKEPSLHNWILNDSGTTFEIVGESSENYIEAIEYKDKNYFIVGVQYHAELEDQNDILFSKFIKESIKRK